MFEQRLGWLDAEPVSQEVKLAIVLLSQLVARVNQHLNLGTEAQHGSFVHPPPSRKSFGRIDPLSAVVHLIDTSALRIESDWVNINLASTGIDHHEALWRSPGDQGISKAVEQLDDSAHVAKPDHEVEVVVLACLMPEQRVHTPTAVEPGSDSVAL